MKALIIDDSIVEIEIIQALLLDAGVKSEALSSGHNVIEKTIEYEPDIILLDLSMPEVSGFQVCQQLVDNFSTRHIPILIISSSTDAKSKVEAMKAGGTDYITKPYKAENVVFLVKRYGALGEILNMCKSLTKIKKMFD